MNTMYFMADAENVYNIIDDTDNVVADNAIVVYTAQCNALHVYIHTHA